MAMQHVHGRMGLTFCCQSHGAFRVIVSGLGKTRHQIPMAFVKGVTSHFGTLCSSPDAITFNYYKHQINSVDIREHDCVQVTIDLHLIPSDSCSKLLQIASLPL
jgi:hypothetical protein